MCIILSDAWRYIQGTSLVDRSLLPEGNKQIFIMSENLSDILREDLAWESFIMLRNTNTMSVVIPLLRINCENANRNIILMLFSIELYTCIEELLFRILIFENTDIIFLFLAYICSRCLMRAWILECTWRCF